MPRSFSAKLAAIQAQNQSEIGLVIAPQLERLPLPIQRYDDPFFPFGKAIIGATHDLVCAYIFDLAAYLALGAAGAIALERTIDYAGSEIITILHGAFALPAFAQLSDENSFGVDALTINDKRYIETFTARPDRGVFILSTCKTAPNNKRDREGIYWLEDNLLTIGCEEERILQIRTVVYAGQGDDFTQVLRSQIEQMRHG
jgi:orotidine-5'-phosphate decarboxylase